VLINDGEPISRQIAVKKILSTTYDTITIECKKTRYDRSDELFGDQHYSTVRRPKNFNDREVIDFYLENYYRLNVFSKRYDYEFHSRDHGYFSAVKRFWYQFGDDMPPAPDQYHDMMYEKFRPIFESLVSLIANLPLKMDKDMIRKNLMLRLNHNPPGSESDGYLTPRHADNSIITLWLHQNCPGAMIDQGQDEPINQSLITDHYDPIKEVIVLPGFDYCDWKQTMTPATWHSVINHSNSDRASLVAFLKY